MVNPDSFGALQQLSQSSVAPISYYSLSRLEQAGIGNLPAGVTATDLVLRITELCREFGVVGKFVEFYGAGLSALSIPDRATISNMAPEQGSTVSFFPIDAETLNYMRLSGRSLEQIALTERYAKEQGLFRTDNTPDPVFTQIMEVDLGTIEPA
jgi:aconitate hydratase